MRYPFIGARRHGGSQSTTHLKRIVMHSTVTPCETGWARKVAGWFHTWDKAASAHYVVDPTTIIKCLHDNQVAYHAPPNTGTLGIEQTDSSNHDSSDVWLKGDHLKMLKLSAALVAAKCKAYNVPVVWLSVADLKAGKRGITSHNNVSLAWHQTTHTDPGEFPAADFIEMVKAAGQVDDNGGGGDRPPAVDGDHQYPGHVLKRGSSGTAVKAVQTELNARAKTAPHLTVDGDYGPATEQRVKGFQGQHGLAKDGVVGPKTWKALFG